MGRHMEPPQTAPDRSGWYAKKCASLDEMRTENIRFWQRQGGAAIRQAAWELVVDKWLREGRTLKELKFQRVPQTWEQVLPS